MHYSFAELKAPADVVAPRLLGCELIREINGQKIIGRIVETEAYDQSDAASHSYRGQTPRTAVMFGPSGYVYVYFTYGMHYCMNVVTGDTGHGSAVLIRALEITEGKDIAKAHRPKITNELQLANGPAKLCRALQVGRNFNGHDLHDSPLQLALKSALSADQIVTSTRIGITHDADRPWRFYVKGNSYISRA